MKSLIMALIYLLIVSQFSFGQEYVLKLDQPIPKTEFFSQEFLEFYRSKDKKEKKFGGIKFGTTLVTTPRIAGKQLMISYSMTFSLPDVGHDDMQINLQK